MLGSELSGRGFKSHRAHALGDIVCYNILMKQCEICQESISVYSRYCRIHSDEVRKEKDKNRKRQLRQDGAAYAKVREAQTRQRETKRKIVCDYLIQNPCIDCGESDILVLEFDHRGDTPKKSDVITMMNNGCSVKTMMHEIEKCDVRCCNCHRRKTIERFGETYRTRYALVSALPPK